MPRLKRILKRIIAVERDSVVKIVYWYQEILPRLANHLVHHKVLHKDDLQVSKDNVSVGN